MSWTQDRIHHIVEKQRELFRSGKTLDVSETFTVSGIRSEDYMAFPMALQ